MDNFTESKNLGIARIRDEARLRYNPLNNLTPQRITQAMDSFRCGYLSDAAKIYDAIRCRDGVVQACVQKRKRATSRLGWSIVEMGTDSAASAAQAEFLEDFFNNITVTSAEDANKRGSMSMMFDNILSALENKYAVSEIIWHPENAPRYSAEVRHVPLWFFENKDGILKFKKSSFDADGVELEKDGWMVSVADSPMMEATAVCWIIKRFAQADWACCSQRFASPTPVYGSTAQRGTPEWSDAVDTLSQLANGFGIVTAAGETFDLKSPAGTGAPFKTLCDEMNRNIALIWRGCDLSTLSADNAGASLQSDESEILEDADCALVEETIAHYLSLPALRWRFGDVQPAAYLQLTRKNRKDKLNQIAVYKGAAEIGCPVAKRDVYEALELREPEADEDITQLRQSTPATDMFANSRTPKDADIDELSRAMGSGKEKLFAELERIDGMTDVVQRADAIAELERNLAQYFDGGKAEADALMKILKRRLANEK